MPIDLSNVNLDGPAFPNQGEVIAPTEGSQPTKEIETERKGEVPPTSGGEPLVEQRVPYSRLQEAVEARREAERRAEELEAEIEARKYREPSRESPREVSGDLPMWWVKMYGDNENARAAFSYWEQGQQSVKEDARREALEAVRAEREFESKSLVTNERLIDDRLEDFSNRLGRSLSSTEEDELLSIVDEYTPTDSTGNYAGDLLSFEKAWDIKQMRQSQEGNRRSSARRAPTELTSSRTESESTDLGRQDRDAKWNPLDWNSYTKRIPNN